VVCRNSYRENRLQGGRCASAFRAHPAFRPEIAEIPTNGELGWIVTVAPRIKQMGYTDLVYFLQHVGKDPSRLIFEDELTGIFNRRFLLNFFQHKIPWDTLDRQPVSLVMMDVDRFKKINDTYGHDVGDQVLVHVAALLREIAAEKALPIRYGGDEFMILMPRGAKPEALAAGEQLVRLVREKPARLGAGEVDIPVTLSIGVASAPDDAKSGKGLIQQADTALYYAKKAGRDQFANASEVSSQEVFGKAALHHLDRAIIAGRKMQLAQVAEALKKFSQRRSQFLLTEGAPGMGKSEFLHTVQRNLTQTRIPQVKVSCSQQELFRPYYLATSILMALLQQRQDQGVSIFQSLSAADISHLSHLLPHLGGTEKPAIDDEKAQRQGIFAALMNVIPKLVDSRPLILLVDDLHLSDEASLLLFRRLLLRREPPLFICATATETPPGRVDGQAHPLKRFYAVHCRELDIHKVTLNPLTASDIRDHLRGIFPQIKLPTNFERELEQITQGNPLFLNEVVRTLVLDEKITLVGQQWVIEPLEPGYLPRSLEEIVKGQISTLDDESRKLLDHASILGDRVSLSVLAGSSEEREARILAFIDQAVAQGLIKADFQMNDETIHFLGRRVQDIVYGAIQHEVRQELHERVGTYQEVLYEQRLLPSAATLAYHFKRSANQEKANIYEQTLAAYNRSVFDPDEAAHYTGEPPRDRSPAELPIDPATLVHIPTVLRSLLLAVRNAKLYPSGSKAIRVANEQAREAIDKFLEKNESLTIFHIKQALLVNGQRIDTGDFRFFAESFIKFLTHLDLQGLAFKKGLPQKELSTLLEYCGRLKGEKIDQRFWQRFSEEQGLSYIELSQIHYAVVAEPVEASPQGQEAAEANPDPAAEMASRLALAEQRLSKDQAAHLPAFLRALLNATRSVKLYPLTSKAVGTALQQLMETLLRLIGPKSALSLARVENSLLVNGEKVEFSEIETLGQAFFSFLDSLALTSITFLGTISPTELRAFIGALSRLPPVGLDTNFWMRLAQEQRISSILFDRRLYETRASSLSLTGFPQQVGLVAAQGAEQREQTAPAAEEDLDALLAQMPVRLSDLLLKGDEGRVKQIIRRLVQRFLGGSVQNRQEVVNRLQDMMKGLNRGLLNQLAKVLADPLLLLFSKEQDPVVVRELASLLHQLSIILIQFLEYPTASRILLHLHRRHRQLVGMSGEQAASLAKVIARPLPPETQQLLRDDFRSGDPRRHQHAAQLLGSLDRVGWPLLIEVIKCEQDLRVRQTAASLLAEHGEEAARLLKKELLLQATSQERLRILEVIDSVTHDVSTELAFALADEQPEVRQAALQLAERLPGDQVERVLMEQAENTKAEVAIGALRSLGKLRPQAALQRIIATLSSSKDPQRLVACCQIVGEIAHPDSIEPLANLLGSKGILRWRKRYSPDVRASAAFALSQIAHPDVAAILACYHDDRDPRVREVARTIPPSTRPPPA
jgi:diguanylate cyclase (GGDEF)-like protein